MDVHCLGARSWLVSNCRKKSGGGAKSKGVLWLDLPRILFTFLIVNVLWILFRVSTISDFWGFVSRIISNPFDGEYLKDYFYFNVFLIITVFIKDIFSERGLICVLCQNRILKWCIYLILFVFILLYGVLDSGQFIYVSF